MSPSACRGAVREMAPPRPASANHRHHQREKHAGPEKGAGEIRYLEGEPRHLENAGRHGYGRAQGPGEAADGNADGAPALKETHAASQRARISRQRPGLADAILVAVAEPERHPVAERSTNRPGNPYRGKIERPCAHQSADRDERGPCRDNQRQERQRLSECEDSGDRSRPSLMRAHEIGKDEKMLLEHGAPRSPSCASFAELRSSGILEFEDLAPLLHPEHIRTYTGFCIARICSNTA